MDYQAITTQLVPTGVFDTATVIDPEALVWVTVNLCETNDPNEYMVWLAMFAERYQVSTSQLATDVLKVLAVSEDLIDAEVARNARNESRHLELTAA